MNASFRLFLSFFLSLFLANVFCQSPYSDLHSTINIHTHPTQQQYTIDSLTLFSVHVDLIIDTTRQTLNDTLYEVESNQIIFNDLYFKKYPDSTALHISYQTLPYDFAAPVFRIDSSRLKPAGAEDYIGLTYEPFQPNTQLINHKDLRYSGSFARGISFGNSQNLVLNSSFNLQLAGELGDGTEILAAITDNNIPLQAEGNTQQLQEFDKIFIQIRKNQHQLIAGDYELKRPNSYFMNYFKKLQGATYETTLKPLDSVNVFTRASVAIARGKFARNVLQAQEGNQGPYRLMGNDGETFIIALAGTEKVFFDGVLLTRGLENDYIIDYNRADITFTSNRLVTKDSRIIVEFEYSDQRYLRSLYAADADLKYKNWRIHFNLFSEQDSKNSSGIADLDSLQQDLLSRVGDETANIFANSIRPVENFDEFRIQYQIVDTTALINGRDSSFSILSYTTNPELASVTASFTYVGEGAGNYERDLNNQQNGSVFIWIAPDPDGSPNGSFEPLTELVAPTQRQMFTLGASYQLNRNGVIQTELALSNNDRNRFSSVGDDDDRGIGVFSSYVQAYPFKKEWKLQSSVAYEFVQKQFSPLNPYRSAEFSRDWNLANNNNELLNVDAKNEHLATIGIKVQKSKMLSSEYKLSTFNRSGEYQGVKQYNRNIFAHQGFLIDAILDYTDVESKRENSNFFRPSINASKVFNKLYNFKIGFLAQQEKNQRFLSGSDSLNNTSFYFNKVQFYAQSAENEKFNIAFSGAKRWDYAPDGEKFTQNTEALEWTLNGKWLPAPHSRLTWTYQNRSLSITEAALTAQTPQVSNLGRIDYRLKILKNSIRSFTSYEIGSGQVPRIAYNYLSVNPGEGNYYWDEELDYNNDGVPQVNEIREEAYTGEGNIIRVNISTNEFIRTNNLTLNESLQTDWRRWIKKEKGIASFVKKLSSTSTLRINRKTSENENVSAYDPFQFNIPDSALVALNTSIRNTLFFNRANPKYDLQMGHSLVKNKIVLTSGAQSRRTEERFFRTRVNFTRFLSTQLELVKGQRLNDHQFFDNQDFNIHFTKIQPQLTFQPSNFLRLIASYEYKNSKNRNPSSETALKNDFSLSCTYNKTTSTSIRAKLSFVNMNYNGPTNTPVEFEILETLKEGKNYLWNIAFNKTLSKNILMSINYEGRKINNQAIVHIARAQVRANF